MSTASAARRARDIARDRRPVVKAEELHALALRLERLAPDFRDPHRFTKKNPKLPRRCGAWRQPDKQ